MDENDVQNNQSDTQPLPSTYKWTKDYPLHQIIGGSLSRVKTRSTISNECLFVNSLSFIDPTKPSKALKELD